MTKGNPCTGESKQYRKCCTDQPNVVAIPFLGRKSALAAILAFAWNTLPSDDNFHCEPHPDPLPCTGNYECRSERESLDKADDPGQCRKVYLEPVLFSSVWPQKFFHEPVHEKTAYDHGDKETESYSAPLHLCPDCSPKMSVLPDGLKDKNTCFRNLANPKTGSRQLNDLRPPCCRGFLNF